MIDINKLSKKDKELVLLWRIYKIPCGHCEFLEYDLTCKLSLTQCPKITVLQYEGNNKFKELREPIKESKKE